MSLILCLHMFPLFSPAIVHEKSAMIETVSTRPEDFGQSIFLKFENDAGTYILEMRDAPTWRHGELCQALEALTGRVVSLRYVNRISQKHILDIQSDAERPFMDYELAYEQACGHNRTVSIIYLAVMICATLLLIYLLCIAYIHRN